MSTERMSTHVISRKDLFYDTMDTVDEDILDENTNKMDSIMRQLFEISEDQQQQEEEEGNKQEDEQEDTFSFPLFSNQSISVVDINDNVNSLDDISRAIAAQQIYEFDETEPEFVSRIQQVVVDYDTIIKQSSIPYPALRLPKRVLHISNDTKDTEVLKKRKRKSKKCRDFERAVKKGSIVVKPNMRHPSTAGGWPGWPGELNKVAIINYTRKYPSKKGNKIDNRPKSSK
ncbi:hypothetical protein BDB01DRAFT_896702 [Pilobolus umbonatus]|nr:hypothetical protein BDB01DRAFT_896702 [Pilobolus umbonatus]